MKKKIIAIILVIAMVIPSYADKQSELNSIRSDIQNIQEKKSNTSVQLNEINQKILALDDQIADIQNKIASTQRQIDEVQAKIDTNEKKVEEKKKEIKILTDALKSRVRVMSKIKPMDYVQIIFSSKNIKDFFSNYTIIKKIVEQDKNNINKLESAKKELEKVSQELKISKSNLDKLKADYKSQNDVLTKAKAEQQKNLAKIEKDMSALEQLENLKSQQAQDIAEEIRRLSAQSYNNSSAGGSYQGSYGGGQLGYPVANPYVTSPYGYRIHPILGYKKFHTGVDFAGGTGTPIYASESGMVIWAGPKGTYGNAVMIDHGGGIVTLYAHCSSVAVFVGQTVSKGNVIAYIGSTGRSTGPHLHYEVRVNGEHTNPMNYL